MAHPRDKYKDKRWSQPVTMATAAKSLPVLVRLEEGNRGRTEETCVSQGDVMALQSCTKVRGRDAVLAHYMRESDLLQDEAAAAVEGELYRALMVLYLDSSELAGLEVSMLEDPGGLAYKNWVKSYFPNHNWADKDSEAHKAVASGDIEDDDDDDIVVYTYYTNVGTVKSTVPSSEAPPMPPKPGKKMPPAPLPKPGKTVPPDPLPKPATDGEGPIQELPPPRPPKSGALSMSRFISHSEPSAPPQARLPPRPHRHHSEDTKKVVIKDYDPDQTIQDYDPGDDDVYRGGQYEEVGGKEDGIYEINLDDDAKPGDDGYLPFSPSSGLGFSFTLAETLAPAHFAPPPPRPAKPGQHPKPTALLLPKSPDTKDSGGESSGMLKKIEKIYHKMKGTKHADSGHEPTRVPPVYRPPAPIPHVAKSPAAKQSSSSAAGNDDSDDMGEYIEPDDSESEDPPYTEIDEQTMIDYNQIRAGKSAALPPESTSKDKKKVKKQRSSASEQKARSERPMMQVRPLQAIPPSLEAPHPMMAPVGGVQRELKSSTIASMSVAELAERLEKCGMEKLAQTCQDNHVDGNFFLDLNAARLKAQPFSLTDWDITRVEKVQTGWVPRE